VVGRRELAIDFGVQGRTARCARTRWASAARAMRPPPRGHRGDGADRAGGDRGRRARLLDLAHARPHSDERRAGTGTFAARMSSSVSAARWPRRAGRLRAGPAGSAGEDLIARHGAGVDERLSAEIAGGVVRADPGRRGAALWRELDGQLGARSRPGTALPAVAARPFGMLTASPATTPSPTAHYRALSHLSPDERRSTHQPRCGPRSCPRPTSRLTGEALRRAQDMYQYATDRIYHLGDPPDYEPTRERTVAAIAEDRGVTPLEAMYDLMSRARRRARRRRC